MGGLEGKLRKPYEFDAVLQEGRRAAGGSFVAYVRLRGDGGLPRVGYSVSRRFGGAVERNRAKRRARAAWARVGGMVLAGVDVVLVPRRRILSSRFEDLCGDLAAVLRRAGALRDEPTVRGG